MGIQGLTTYLRKNQSKTAAVENLSSLANAKQKETGGPLYLAVDGTAFHFIISDLVYQHLLREYRDNKVALPFVYGGQYQALNDAVHSFVSTFRSHGIELMFFFDSLSTPDQDAFKAVERARRREDNESALTILYEILETKSFPSSSPELPDVLPTATRRQVQLSLAELNVFMMRVPGEADHAIAYLLGVYNKALPHSKGKDALENLVPGLPYAVLGRDSDFAVLPGCRYIDLNDCLYLPHNPVLNGVGVRARLAKHVIKAMSKDSSITSGELTQTVPSPPKEDAAEGEESKGVDAVELALGKLHLDVPQTSQDGLAMPAGTLDGVPMTSKHTDSVERSSEHSKGDGTEEEDQADAGLDAYSAALVELEAFESHSDHIWALVYTPERLADSLGIDVALLPQFAAFAGCDYTKVILQETSLRSKLRIDTDMGNVAATAEWMRSCIPSTSGASFKLWKQKKVQKSLRQCDKEYTASSGIPWLNVAAAHELPGTAGKLFLRAMWYCQELYTLGPSVTKPYRHLATTLAKRLRGLLENKCSEEELHSKAMRKMALSLLYCDHDEWEYRGRFVTERSAAVVGFETPPPSMPAFGPPTLLACLEKMRSPCFPIVLQHISRSLSHRPSVFELLRPLRAMRAGFYSTPSVKEYFNFPNRSARPFPGAPVLVTGIVVPSVEPPAALRNGATDFSAWCHGVVKTLFERWHPEWNHRMPFAIPLKGDLDSKGARGTRQTDEKKTSNDNQSENKEGNEVSEPTRFFGSDMLPWFEGAACNFELRFGDDSGQDGFDALVSSIRDIFPVQWEPILVGYSILRYLLVVQACQSAAAQVPPDQFPPRGATMVSAPATVPATPVLYPQAVTALLAQLLMAAHIGALEDPSLGLKEFLGASSLPLPEMVTCNVSAAYLATYKELLNLQRLRTEAPSVVSVQPRTVFDGFLFQYFLSMPSVSDVVERLESVGLSSLFSELHRSLLFGFKLNIAGQQLAPEQQFMLTFSGALSKEAKVEGGKLFESLSAQLQEQQKQLAACEFDVDEEITEFTEGKTVESEKDASIETQERPTTIDMVALAKSVRFPGKSFISPAEFKALTAAQRGRLTRNATSEFPSRGNTQQLPIHQHAETILYELHTRAILLITADTGSGKSTQVPQFILRCHRREERIRQSDHDKRMSKLPREERVRFTRRKGPRILVSQPRRVAAIRLAERVAHELGTHVGEGVGYRIGQDAKVSKATNITFCTAGWLRTWLLHNLDDISTYSHIVLDEVHERSIDVDMVCLMIKTAIQHCLLSGKKPPKIVLMSATYDSQVFAQYFSLNGLPPPLCLHVGNKRFPVTTKYLDDLINERPTEAIARHASLLHNAMSSAKSVSLVAKTMSKRDTLSLKLAFDAVLAYTEPGDAAIVFVPGMSYIVLADDIISDMPPLVAERISFRPAHSEIENMGSLDEVDPDRVSIYVSTNVLESSVTIPNLKMIVDLGLHKHVAFDSTSGVGTLCLGLVSKASAQQRAGRAGRNRPGIALRLYPERVYELMADYEAPELCRSSLETVVLQFKALEPIMGEQVAQIIQKVIQPPDMSSIEHALQRLLAVGAIDSAHVSGGVTPLGQFYTSFPGNVYAGSMVGVGVALGCVADAALLAVCASASVFYIPGVYCFGDLEEHQRSVCKGMGTKFMAAEGSYSDAIAVRNAYLAWKYQQTGYRHVHFEQRKRGLGQWCYRRGIKEGQLKLLDAEFKRVLQLTMAAFPSAADETSELLDKRVWEPELFDFFTENLDTLKILLFAGFHRNLATARAPKKAGEASGTCNDIHVSNLPAPFPGLAPLVPSILPAPLRPLVEHVGVPQGPATADGAKPQSNTWIQFRPLPREGRHDHGLLCWKDVAGRGVDTCPAWLAVDQPHKASITEALFQGVVGYWASVKNGPQKAKLEKLLAFYGVERVELTPMSSVLTSPLSLAPRLLLYSKLKVDKQKLLPIPEQALQGVNAGLERDRKRNGVSDSKESVEEWAPQGIGLPGLGMAKWEYSPLASLCRFEWGEESEEQKGESKGTNRRNEEEKTEPAAGLSDDEGEEGEFGYELDCEEEEAKLTWDDYVQQPYESVERRMFFPEERSVVASLPHSRVWPNNVQQYMMFTEFRVAKNNTLVQVGLSNTALWPSDEVIAFLLLVFSRDLRLSGVLTVKSGKSHLSKIMAHFSQKRGINMKVGLGLRELLLANVLRKDISRAVCGVEGERSTDQPLDMIMHHAAELASVTAAGGKAPHARNTLPDFGFSPGNHKVYFAAASSPGGHFSEYLPPWKLICGQRNCELPYAEHLISTEQRVVPTIPV